MVLLYLTSVLYQGVSAVMLAFPSICSQDAFRDGIASQFTDDAALLTSAEMLTLVVAYLLTRPQRGPFVPLGDTRALVRALDWRIFAAPSVPLAVLTYEGRGYFANLGSSAPVPFNTNLAGRFFVPMVVLAACGLVLRHGKRWFLPVLVIQSAMLAAAGERLPVAMGAVALIVMLARAKMRPSRAQLHAAAGLTVAAILAVMGARAEYGRALFYGDSGPAARAQALAAGVTSAQKGLVVGTATRLDGNAFTGGILQAEHMGHPCLSAAYVPESLLITVPSALWPSKLSHSLDPYQTEINAFGLQQTNFLPTLPGVYAGFLAPTWLVIFMAFLGAVFGWLERRLLSECTPARLVMLAGAVIAVLSYEEGLPGMLLALRAALVVAAAMKLLELARSRRRTPALVSVR